MNVKFDTGTKKPKLYHLIAETIVAALIVLVLVRLDAQRYAGWIGAKGRSYVNRSDGRSLPPRQSAGLTDGLDAVF